MSAPKPGDPKRHKSPVWGDKSNMLLRMKADMTQPRSPVEEIPARKTPDGLYEICCVPFFVYDLNLGDKVEMRDVDGRNIVSDVVETAGHHTFRVWFQHNSRAVRDGVEEELRAMGCLIEWFDSHLLALSAPDTPTATRVAAFLEECEAARKCKFETGRTH